MPPRSRRAYDRPGHLRARRRHRSVRRREVLALLAKHRYGAHQADARQLTQEWDTYRDGFLTITAAACGAPQLDTRQESTPA
ncbi:hypothetical protein [Streptomyces sp. NPDC002746]